MPLLGNESSNNFSFSEKYYFLSIFIYDIIIRHSTFIEESQYKNLYNYLLRNESGIKINFWDSPTTLNILQQFCKVNILLIFLQNLNINNIGNACKSKS